MAKLLSGSPGPCFPKHLTQKLRPSDFLILEKKPVPENAAVHLETCSRTSGSRRARRELGTKRASAAVWTSVTSAGSSPQYTLREQ